MYSDLFRDVRVSVTLWEEIMKQFFTPRWLLTVLTGCLFAAYSAFQVFVILRDIRAMSPENIVIRSLVGLMFAILAIYMWTAGIKGKKHILFMIVRRTSFIIAMLVIIALKLRMVIQVINYMDYTRFYTVLYGVSYFMMLLALMILFFYYVFILNRLPFFPRAGVILPRTAIVLFLLSLIAEQILFYVYGIGLEANAIRSMVMQPVFYLGFIGLSLHFLYPVQLTKKPKKKDTVDAPSE